MPHARQSTHKNLLPQIVAITVVFCVLVTQTVYFATLSGLYSCVVLYSLRSSHRSHTYFTAMLGTLVVVLQALYATRPIEVPLQVILIAAIIVLTTFWGTAWLGVNTVHRAREESAAQAEALAQAEHHREEKQLADRLLSAAEAADLWMWEGNGDGTTRWELNPPASLGWHSSDDLTHRSSQLQALLGAEQWQRIESSITTAIKARQLSVIEHFTLLPEGSTEPLYFRMRLSLQYDAAQQLTGILGIHINITEEVKRARLLEQQIEAQLRSKERMMIAARASGAWAWEGDAATGRMIWDENRLPIAELQNVPCDQVALQMRELIDPEDFTTTREQIAAAAARGDTRYQIEFRVRTGGEIFYLRSIAEILYDAAGKPLRFIGITLDISTEIRRLQEEQAQLVRERQAVERMNIAACSGGLWIWERDARTLAVVWDMNRPSELSLDTLTHAQLDAQLRQRMVPGDAAQLAETVQEAIRTGQRSYTLQYRTVHGAGFVRHRQSTAEILYDAAGNATRIVGVTRDVTNEVQTTQMMQRQAQYEREVLERLSIAAKAAGMHCWRMDFPGPEYTWSENESVQLAPGTQIQSLTELTTLLRDSLHPEDHQTLRDTTREAIHALLPQHRVEFRRRAADGSVRYFRGFHHYYYRPDGKPSHVVGATVDITAEVTAAQQLRQQSEELQLLHERLTRAAESSQEGHWEIDFGTQAYWLSESYRALLGYGDDVRLDTVETFRQIIHPDDLPPMDEQLRHLRADDKYDAIMRLRHASGQWRWFQTRGGLETDAEGRPLRLTGSVRDIHEQHLVELQLEETQQRFERAIHGTQDCLWEMEFRTEKLWLSPRFTLMTGYPAEEIAHWQGRDLHTITHPDDIHLIETVRARVITEKGMPFDVEHRLRTQSGAWIWVKVRGTIEYDRFGEPLRISGSLQDITEARRVHDELLAATEEAQAASRAKSAFLANMSHEIRTPMNGIIGMTGLLLDTKLDQTQREFAETVRGSADALLTVINDILDFSKIEAGKLDIESIEMDLRSNVEDVGAMLGFQAASKNLELIVNVHPEIPEHVIGDPQRIRQCLINLVGNAIKFTRQGEVVIEVFSLGKQHGKMLLHFEVRDTGIGIAPEVVKNLFQPFTQADSSTTRQFGGTGLGLSIVKRLVEMMGGSIGVESRTGQGSTFWFTLPLEAVVTRVAPPPQQSASHHGRVLIVDDNETNRRVLSLQLGHAGYEVVTAGSGREALTILGRSLGQRQHFDVIITDFQMPDMDGAMFGARVNTELNLQRTPMILLTSMDRHGDTHRYAAMGFAAYLTKPARAQALLDCIDRVAHRDSSDTHLGRPLITQNVMAEQSSARRYHGHVLLTEDNIVNQKVAQRFLERLGLQVTVASDGAEAVRLFEANSYALVLMDLQMPIMDGFQATRRIRDFEGWRPRTPIIALTANAMQGQMERCLAAGMDGFLTKPIDIELLRQTIAQYCREQGAEPTTSPLETLENEVIAAAAVATLLETPVAHTAHLDRERLKQAGAGDADFIRELGIIFIRSGEHIIEELEQACQAGDASACARAMHKLKGASANVGAETIRKLCQQLEADAATMAMSEWPPYIEQLSGLLKATAAELEQVIQRDQPAA